MNLLLHEMNRNFDVILVQASEIVTVALWGQTPAGSKSTIDHCGFPKLIRWKYSYSKAKQPILLCIALFCALRIGQWKRAVLLFSAYEGLTAQITHISNDRDPHRAVFLQYSNRDNKFHFVDMLLDCFPPSPQPKFLLDCFQTMLACVFFLVLALWGHPHHPFLKSILWLETTPGRSSEL